MTTTTENEVTTEMAIEIIKGQRAVMACTAEQRVARGLFDDAIERLESDAELLALALNAIDCEISTLRQFDDIPLSNFKRNLINDTLQRLDIVLRRANR